MMDCAHVRIEFILSSLQRLLPDRLSDPTFHSKSCGTVRIHPFFFWSSDTYCPSASCASDIVLCRLKVCWFWICVSFQGNDREKDIFCSPPSHSLLYTMYLLLISPGQINEVWRDGGKTSQLRSGLFHQLRNLKILSAQWNMIYSTILPRTYCVMTIWETCLKPERPRSLVLPDTQELCKHFLQPSKALSLPRSFHYHFNPSVIVLVPSSLWQWRCRDNRLNHKYIIDGILCSLKSFKIHDLGSLLFFTQKLKICTLSSIPSQWKTKDHVLSDPHMYYCTDTNWEK